MEAGGRWWFLGVLLHREREERAVAGRDVEGQEKVSYVCVIDRRAAMFMGRSKRAGHDLG